jgi:hypothetical protein
MTYRLHIGRPAEMSARTRALRIMTVLAATVALTPIVTADARPPSRIDDRSAAAAPVQCPCNAGLPVGTSATTVVPGALAQVQRVARAQVQRPGPAELMAATPATPPATASVASESDGFDWSDAAAGAGVVAVLGGLLLAAGRVRSRPLPG